jgi:hypothetical protein
MPNYKHKDERPAARRFVGATLVVARVRPKGPPPPVAVVSDRRPAIGDHRYNPRAEDLPL